MWTTAAKVLKGLKEMGISSLPYPSTLHHGQQSIGCLLPVTSTAVTGTARKVADHHMGRASGAGTTPCPSPHFKVKALAAIAATEPQVALISLTPNQRSQPVPLLLNLHYCSFTVLTSLHYWSSLLART